MEDVKYISDCGGCKDITESNNFTDEQAYFICKCGENYVRYLGNGN